VVVEDPAQLRLALLGARVAVGLRLLVLLEEEDLDPAVRGAAEVVALGVLDRMALAASDERLAVLEELDRVADLLELVRLDVEDDLELLLVHVEERAPRLLADDAVLLDRLAERLVEALLEALHGRGRGAVLLVVDRAGVAGERLLLRDPLE